MGEQASTQADLKGRWLCVCINLFMKDNCYAYSHSVSLLLAAFQLSNCFSWHPNFKTASPTSTQVELELQLVFTNPPKSLGKPLALMEESSLVLT